MRRRTEHSKIHLARQHQLIQKMIQPTATKQRLRPMMVNKAAMMVKTVLTSRVRTTKEKRVTPEKTMDICHVERDGSIEVISIPASEWPEHDAHGDGTAFEFADGSVACVFVDL